jgi:hypothetical protein
VRLAIATLVPLLLAQDSEPIPPSPFDEVHTLELTGDDPPLIDGRGPTAIVELEVEFSGTLHLWTRSELDLFLRVEDTSDESVLGEDDDSGGGDVPYVALPVERGAYLAIFIASASADALGPFELHAVAAPKTAATLAAAQAGAEALAEARRMHAAGDTAAARERIAELVKELSSIPDGLTSHAIVQVLWDLGYIARECGDLGAAQAAWSRVRESRERTLPADHPGLLLARQNLAVTMKAQGDLSGARALVGPQVSGMRALVLGSLARR